MRAALHGAFRFMQFELEKEHLENTLLFAVLYTVVAALGFFSSVLSHGDLPLWPLTGVAIAVLSIYGKNLWPGIVLGSFLAHSLPGELHWSSLELGCANAAEALVAIAMLEFVSRHSHRWRLNPFMTAAATAGALLPSALIGSVGYLCFREFRTADIAGIFFTHWMGEAVGMLLIAPCLASAPRIFNFYSRFGFGNLWKQLGFLAAAGILASLILAKLAVASLVFLLFPAMFFAARGGRRTLTRVIALFVCMLSIWNAARGLVPFHEDNTTQTLLLLNFLVAVVVLTAHVLTAFQKFGSWRHPAVVFLLGWAVSGSLFYFYERNTRAREDVAFQRLVDNQRESIFNLWKDYGSLLQSAASFATTESDFSAREWKRFTAGIKIEGRDMQRYGLGVTGPGLTVKYFAAGRDPDAPHFKPGVHLSSIKGAGRIGLKVASGQRPFTFVAGAGPQAVIFLFYPATPGAPGLEALKSIKDPQAAFWVFTAVPAAELFGGSASAASFAALKLDVFDGAGTNAGSRLLASSANDVLNFEAKEEQTIAGHTFTFAWNRGADHLAFHETKIAWVSIIGLFLTILMTSLTVNLQVVSQRSIQIAEEKTKLLNESRHRFELAVSGSSDGIWDWNLLTNSVFYSPRWMEQIGYKENELPYKIETFFVTLIHPDDRKKVREALNRHLKSRVPYKIEYRMRTKGGEYRWFLERGQGIWSESGVPTRIAGSTTDITERKRAEEILTAAKEEALKGARTKADFLANMSHEIRTPMNSIVGMASLLLETKLTDEQKKYVMAQVRSGNHLLSLINDILDLSKIEAGGMHLERTNFNLREFLARTLEIVNARAYEKGVSLNLAVEPEIAEGVSGDTLRIQQVLLNLLSNAIKFTPKDGRIDIQVKREAGGLCRFSVSDTGIGLSDEFKTRMFDRFSQADTSTTRKFGGTGLGLSICKRLVELMDGKISVESTEGKGSTFHFVIPLPEAAVALKAAPAETPRSTVLPPCSKEVKILLVDDAEENRLLIKAYFKKTPQFHLEMAENGQIGLEKVMAGSFDVVLMDMQMPVMDGCTATKAIRKWEKENGKARTTIIALTANAFKEEELRSMEAGCDLHATKPITKSVLIDLIYRSQSKAA